MAGQVWIEKASISEPPSKASSMVIDIETGGHNHSRDKPIRHPAYRVGGVRRRGGASSIRALPRNCGNPNRDAKGDGQAKKSEAPSTDARFGGGSALSSSEAAVMAAERRGRVVPAEQRANSSNPARRSA